MKKKIYSFSTFVEEISHDVCSSKCIGVIISMKKKNKTKNKTTSCLWKEKILSETESFIANIC